MARSPPTRLLLPARPRRPSPAGAAGSARRVRLANWCCGRPERPALTPHRTAVDRPPKRYAAHREGHRTTATRRHHRGVLGRRQPGGMGRQPVSRHRRLRLPLRLRDDLPDRSERGGRVDVRASARLAVHLQCAPRSQRRVVPDRSLRRDGAGGPPLPARQPDDRDDLADPHRLAHRPRRPVHGSLAQPDGALQDPPALSDRLRRRALPAAHGQVRERCGRPVHDLRPDVRLRPHRARVAATKATGTARSSRPATAPAVKLRITTDLRPGHRAPGPQRPHPHGRGRLPLRGPVVVAAAGRR